LTHNPFPTNEFDWNSDAVTVVARTQQAIAVYQNLHGAVVIREQQGWDEDADTIIVIQPEHARAVAAAILSAAGLATDRSPRPPKDPTAANRQRRRRDRLRDATPEDRDNHGVLL
jgi:hypothetical protein